MHNAVGWEEWFNLDLWTCDLKINRDNLLIEGNPCTKFGIDQVKGSKDIKRTTNWARKSGLTLTFKHVTWKSIRIIYLLRVTSVPSLVLIKGRGQKILSGQHLVYRPTYRPTDNCKTICPLFQGGIKIKDKCNITFIWKKIHKRFLRIWSVKRMDSLRITNYHICIHWRVLNLS